jgi:alpha-tubulin suppressor-like RCC1 family protein
MTLVLWSVTARSDAGNNIEGQLGSGLTALSSPTPVPVVGLPGSVSAITVGAFHACATISGQVECWGYNDFGQLGNGSFATSLSPVVVVGLTTPVSLLTAGYGQTCALTVSGAADCWGYNLFGQLGNGTTTDSSTPVRVVGF